MMHGQTKINFTASTIYSHGDSCNSYENSIEVKVKSLSTPKCVKGEWVCSPSDS